MAACLNVMRNGGTLASHSFVVVIIIGVSNLMATTTVINDVTKQVFEKFIDELGAIGVSTEMVARLRKALLEDGSFSDSALKAAMSEEEQSQ